MELLNSFSLCIFVNRYLWLSKKTDLWEILNNNIYSTFDKNKRKAVNRMLLLHSWKLFIKVVAARHSKWKVFQKQTFHLTSTITSTVLDRKANTIIQILKQLILFLLLFFQISFLSILVFSSFLYFVFRLTTEAASVSKNTFFTELLRTTASVANWRVSRVAFAYHWKAGI